MFRLLCVCAVGEGVCILVRPCDSSPEWVGGRRIAYVCYRQDRIMNEYDGEGQGEGQGERRGERQGEVRVRMRE